MENQTLIQSLLIAVPALFVLGAALSQTRYRWPAALSVAWLAMLAILLAGGFGIAAGEQIGMAGSLLRLSALNATVLLLVGFIALIVIHYSRNNLAGEVREPVYLRWLLLTLAAVTLVVLSNHLLLLVLGWVAISLSLHQLLLFYPERPRAVLAAHKKFLLARLAELSLLGACWLLYLHHGSWQIDTILAAYPSADLSWQQQLAAVLLALTALIKCAQMPVHGWLIQVVEAPTPVSALLHAGIINLGGFLLLLFAPLLVQVSVAQWLLLTIAGLTTVAAALIMMTRISIKVRLAWSTTAQMGMMLIECALGLFELALLHLVAHSCYKSFAFLNAGNAVQRHLQNALAAAQAPSHAAWWAAGLGAFGLVLIAAYWLAVAPPYSPWLLLALALTLLLAERFSDLTRPSLWAWAPLAAVIVLAYCLQKQGSTLLVDALPASAGWPADVWVCGLFALLFGLYMLLRYWPQARLSQQLFVALYGGFYLDEWFTRTTLRLWPVALPAAVSPEDYNRTLRPQEATQ